jgi:hypothetical protein
MMANWKMIANHSVPIEGPPFKLSAQPQSFSLTSDPVLYPGGMYSLRSDSATHMPMKATNHPIRARRKVTRNTG